jgi:hypothetical protein
MKQDNEVSFLHKFQNNYIIIIFYNTPINRETGNDQSGLFSFPDIGVWRIFILSFWTDLFSANFP